MPDRAKPTTNPTVLNASMAIEYCFQSCGPVFSFRSNQRNGAGGCQRLSMTLAMYRPTGMDNATVTPTIKTGRAHMRSTFR